MAARSQEVGGQGFCPHFIREVFTEKWPLTKLGVWAGLKQEAKWEGRQETDPHPHHCLTPAHLPVFACSGEEGENDEPPHAHQGRRRPPGLALRADFSQAQGTHRS